ncbi:CIC11C00000005421 [Sungouiella intermedia]|uniref:CIC11C00000005421 n=1 Tax=Sungouiella intermedia TaxID=45354 RepID=A0A1L0D0C4_9ASCO|nr:CIC11C00000005421 [[Candida] intermedia]
MDLRNLSSTPNQLDSVIQRRPSLSSLSSASGYDSSTYGNTGPSANVIPSSQPGASTPQMGQLRLAPGLNRLYAGMLNNSSSSNLVSSTIPPTAVSTDVGPWVEEQKQQQSLTVTSLDNGKKDLSVMVPGSVKVPQSPTNSMTANISTVTVNTSANIDDDDELIPTAIVIKNIPFAIKKEQLLDVMTKLNLPLPYAFNYHFDNGVFRGLAFANFTLTEETSMVVNHLNGREIGGRKLRVEYKKMLPLQERERIEREKREKRGQLEEQHRSASNASLASLMSAASTTAATKNLSVNGQLFNTQTERLFVQFPPSSVNMPPVDLNFNDPEVLELYSQLLTYRDDNSKLIFELAFSPTLPLNQRKVLSLLCSFLNLLELYDNGFIIIRRKPGQQTIQQRQQQSATFNPHSHPQQAAPNQQSLQHLQQLLQQQHQHQHQQQQQQQQQSAVQNGVQPLHSSSMMNLNQLPALLGNYPANIQQTVPHAPELLRSHSQSALPLPRLRQQTSTPVQQLYSQYQPPSSQQPKQQVPLNSKYQSYGMYGSASTSGGGQLLSQMGTPASSAAALLRSSNNRSFVDVRSNNAFPVNASVSGSPTPQHSNIQSSNLYQQQGLAYFQGGHISQPGTPLGNNELNNRFAPFGQHAHLTGSLTSLQPTSAASEEFPINEPLSSKFSALNMTNGYDQQKAGGIWGAKK